MSDREAAAFYGSRNKIVAKLGFANYGSYLRSKMWRNIRARVLKRDRGTCRFCSRDEASQVHHWTYTRAALCGNGDQHCLWSVCRECHQWIEVHTDGVKTTPAEMREAAQSLALMFGHRFRIPTPGKPKRQRKKVGKCGGSGIAKARKALARKARAIDRQFGQC